MNHFYDYEPLCGLVYTDGQFIYAISRNVGMYEVAKEPRTPVA